MNGKKYINETSFCFACLSSNRTLTSIDYIKQYTNVFVSISNTAKIPQEVLLCWECVAILKRINHFKYRIQNAQRILRSNIVKKQKTIPKSLSRLSIVNTENVICITHDDNDDDRLNDEYNDKQIVTTIKVENVSDDNNLDCDDNFNTPDNKEIKKEKPQIKLKQYKKLHYKIVYGENIYKKSLLRKKFSIQPGEVLMWLENETNSKFYKTFNNKCKMCFHGFNCKEKLLKHNLEFHDKSLGEHVCTICNARFASASALNAHDTAHTYAYECARCGYRCYSMRRLNAHIDAHRLVECVYCGAQCSDVRMFHDHYKGKHSVFVCDHCGKRCKTKFLLEKHIMSCHSTTHKCRTCSREYKSRAALNKHCASKHAVCAPELAYCVRCDKQFTSVAMYRRHVLTATAHAHENHTLVKQKVTCPECGQVYSRRAYMMNHYRHVHAKESKHHCELCDRHFLNRTRYVDHMRYKHEGVTREKNKLCNICGRGFATNRILLNHIRTHSGERPFECEFCAAKFTQKHSMLSHVKYIHLKSKRRPTW